MADDLARRLKQPPARGLHLRPLPSASKRIGTKAEKQIVGQHPDGKEYGVGLERTTGHVLHAEADFQILDAVLAGVAAPSMDF